MSFSPKEVADATHEILKMNCEKMMAGPLLYFIFDSSTLYLCPNRSHRIYKLQSFQHLLRKQTNIIQHQPFRQLEFLRGKRYNENKGIIEQLSFKYQWTMAVPFLAQSGESKWNRVASVHCTVAIHSSHQPAPRNACLWEEAPWEEGWEGGSRGGENISPCIWQGQMQQIFEVGGFNSVDHRKGFSEQWEFTLELWIKIIQSKAKF